MTVWLCENGEPDRWLWVCVVQCGETEGSPVDAIPQYKHCVEDSI